MLMSVTDFQMEKGRDYQENVAKYQLTFKHRDREKEKEKIYDAKLIISEFSER